MKEANQIIFEKYLSGKMTATESAAMEVRLKGEPELRKEFELYKEMELFLVERHEKGDALAALREVGRERSEETIISTEVDSKHKTKLKYLVAIILISLIGICYLLTIKSKEEAKNISYAQLYVEPAWPVVRSHQEDEISLAIAAYLQGNTSAAKDSLRAMDTDESRYWLAEIYAKEIVSDSTLKYLSPRIDGSLNKDRQLYLEIISNYQLKNDDKVDLLLEYDIDQYYKILLTPLSEKPNQ